MNVGGTAEERFLVIQAIPELQPVKGYDSVAAAGAPARGTRLSVLREALDDQSQVEKKRFAQRGHRPHALV